MKSTSATTSLKELAKREKCPAFIALVAPDRVRRDRALAFLLDTFASDGYKPRSFTFNDQGRASFPMFLADVAEPSLFEPERFVLVKNIHAARAADLEPLIRLVISPPPGLHMILLGESLPNAQSLRKSLEKGGEVIEFEALKGAELRRWTERELKQAGITSSSDELVEAIISLGGDAPEAIAGIVEKYALFLGDDQAGIRSLQAMFPGRTHASDFELAESLLLGKRGATEVLLHQLLGQGSSPFMLMGLLTKTLITLLRIRTLADRGFQAQDIRTDLGITPWLFNKYLPLSKRFTAPTLSRHLEAVLKADFRLKDRSLGPGAIMSTLAHEISRGA